MIKALIFDFDGLIVDTETPSYYAFRDVYKEYGAELNLETYVPCIGTSFSVFNPYTHISQCIGREIEYQEIRGKFKARYNALLEQAELRPGVREYLEAGKQLGLRIGIASSSEISWIRPHLDRFGIGGYFDHIMTADQVTKVKPDPELYLRSLQELGVTGREAISFEDSLNGFTAAKAAGLRCVVVPNEVTRQLDFTGYDLMISSMNELPLGEVIRKLA